MLGSEPLAIASVIAAILAASYAIDSWSRLRELQTLTLDLLPSGNEIPSRPISRRAPVMKELEKVYGIELSTAIRKYEVALGEHRQYDAAAREAKGEADRLERLSKGVLSNLWDAEKDLKRELKSKGEGFTIVAESGRVYSEAILGSDEFPEPPVAVLQG